MNYEHVIALVNGMEPWRYWITFLIIMAAVIVIGALWAGRPLWVRWLELSFQSRSITSLERPPPGDREP